MAGKRNCRLLQARRTELEALIGAVSQGKEEAMSRLYNQTSSLVYSVALRTLQHRQDAEEITLDVYMQIWRRASTFDSRRGDPLAWMLTITRSRAIDRVRARARLRVLDEISDELAETVAAPENPERSSFLAERWRHIRSALHRLPPEQRRLVEFSFLNGLSHREIAVQLELPLGTIKTRIRLALIKLRSYLQPLESANYEV